MMTTSSREILNEFRSKILDGLVENPLVRDERMVSTPDGIPIGALKISMMGEYSDKPFVLLCSIRAFHRGGGRRAMEYLIMQADLLKLPIELFVVPTDPVYGIRGLGKTKLKAWYRGFGFRPIKPESDRYRKEPGSTF